MPKASVFRHISLQMRVFPSKRADLDNHSYKMYDKIEVVENQLISTREKKQSVEAEKRQYLQGADLF